MDERFLFFALLIGPPAALLLWARMRWRRYMTLIERARKELAEGSSDALEHCRAALRIAQSHWGPESTACAEAWCLVAICRARQGQWAEALECYERASSTGFGPEWRAFRIGVHAARALCHANLGDFDAAEVWLERSEKAARGTAGHEGAPSARFDVSMVGAHIALLRGAPAAAEETLRGLVGARRNEQGGPYRAPPLDHAAATERAAGGERYTMADAYLLLAHVLELGDRNVEARHWRWRAIRSLEEQPDPASNKREIHESLAWGHQADGEWERALVAWMELAASDDREVSGCALANAAYCLECLQRPEEAESTYSRALDRLPEHAGAARAWVLRWLAARRYEHDPEFAVDAFRRAEQLDGTTCEELPSYDAQAFADALFMIGEPADAESLLAAHLEKLTAEGNRGAVLHELSLFLEWAVARGRLERAQQLFEQGLPLVRGAAARETWPFTLATSVFLQARGRFSAVRRALLEALASSPTDRERGYYEWWMAALGWRLGQLEWVRRHLRVAIPLIDDCEDESERITVRALELLAECDLNRDAAEELDFASFQAMAERLPGLSNAAMLALMVRAEARIAAGELEAAAAASENAVVVARRRFGSAVLAERQLAEVLIRARAIRPAREHAEAALNDALRTCTPWHPEVARCRLTLGVALAHEGHTARAKSLLERALRVLRRYRHPAALRAQEQLDALL